MHRSRHLAALSRLLDAYPVVAIIGPRQAGKSTLARALAASGESTFFDLEDDADVARLADPRLALASLRGLVVIDEVQHRPSLFATLRVLADRPGRPATFLVLGSASPALLRQGAESLAGRVAWYELNQVGLDELPEAELLAFRGGLPPSALASDDATAAHWLRQYVRSLSECDLPMLGIDLAPPEARRLLSMLAHLHGGVVNVAALARTFARREPAVRHYLDVLEGAFLIRRLAPWHENAGKRIVRSPKLYFGDVGVLHSMLGLADTHALHGHPVLGYSWESFAMSQVLERLGLGFDDAWFWATHAGAELDLFVHSGGARVGFEFKRTSAPERTRSMAVAMQDLKLDHLFVVHAGHENFPLAERIDAVAIGRVWRDLAP